MTAESSSSSSAASSVDDKNNNKKNKEEEQEDEQEDEQEEEEPQEYKIHISRVPTKFTEEIVERILKDALTNKDKKKQKKKKHDNNDDKEDMNEHNDISVELVYPREDGNTHKNKDNDGNQDDDDDNDETNDNTNINNNKQGEKGGKTNNDNKEKEHRGFGFITFPNLQLYQQALELQTIRGGRKVTSTKHYTMYLRPYAWTKTNNNNKDDTNKDDNDILNQCYLWTLHRCPYGDNCKFLHSGPGGCKVIASSQNDNDNDNDNNIDKKKKKKGKCFAYKKGKCTKGDDCPFSHDFEIPKKYTNKNEDNNNTNTKEPKESKSKDSTPTDTTTTSSSSEKMKDCINWKTKGKCRKGDSCPYRHDPEKQKEALLKLEKKKKRKQQDGNDASLENQKQKQPLCIRVFGMNYETTKDDICHYFESQHECGKIQKIEFPTFEDSGRSKGYCGIWFSSPKAVEKAIALDGQELHGRWLQIQSGKMYLKQWEERNNQQNQHSNKKQKME